MNSSIPLWLSIASPSVALVSALLVFFGVRHTIRAADQRSREEAAYAMSRLNEQAEHSRRLLEREADRSLDEHILLLYAQQRREAYVDFLKATSDYTRIFAQNRTAHRDEVQRQVVDANDSLWSAVSKILLLAPDDVVEAAQAYRKLLTRKLKKAGSVTNDEQAGLREAFIRSARADLDHKRRDERTARDRTTRQRAEATESGQSGRSDPR